MASTKNKLQNVEGNLETSKNSLQSTSGELRQTQAKLEQALAELRVQNEEVLKRVNWHSNLQRETIHMYIIL